MSASFLERALGGTLPTFREHWQTVQQAYPPDVAPSAKDYLGHLVAHVHHSLAQGRVADVTRLFFAVERLLEDADPMLADLLETHLLIPLAEECRAADLPQGLVLPHLGPRSRAVWQRATMGQ